MVQFKKIKLVGFKSFADKTEIPLTDGVTCIVGPNGCGKSNVADAIRWVLGEQSAKVMRGSNMMDVIFNGTEKRKKTSFCEVTLTFDNTNRIFDYDADEIEMTRRLYRDGTSEYLLNQQPSRMKILTGLLHGAGAAKEGYSIIGQGRIAQIMNSRPEERRSIFEEATGIVVFKERKADAERKLEYSKNNLFVFMQTVTELERHLNALSKAAEATRKYNELYEALRLNEINMYIFRHDGAQGERDKINARIAKANAGIQRCTELATRLMTEYEECRALLSGADAELKRLNEERLSYTVGLAESTGQSRLFSERAKTLIDKLHQTESDLAFSIKRIAEVDKEIHRNEEYARKSGERIEGMRAECAKLEEELGELAANLASMEVVSDEHRKKAMDAIRDLSDIKESIGSLTAKKELIMERLAEMDDAMAQVREERDKLKVEYGAALSAQESTNAFLGRENEIVEEADGMLRAAEEKLQSLIRRIYDCEAQITSLTQSHKTYTAIRDRFEGYAYSVRRLLNDAKTDRELSSHIIGMIADLVSCDKEYETAIETAFGGAMQNIIAQTPDDAQYIVEYMKRVRGGRVTILPIDSLRPHYENAQIQSARKERGALGFAIDLVKYDKKYENVIHNLLGNTLVVDTIANATIISKRYPRAFKIVCLDGDVISMGGGVTGGSRNDSASLLAGERKIKELEEEIEAKKVLLERTEQKKTEAEGELSKARKERQKVDEKLQAAHVELAAAHEKLAGLMASINEKESAYSIYGKTKQQLEEKLAELDSEYTGASRGASSLSAQSDAASSEIDSMTERVDKLTKERAAKTKKLTSLQVEIASLESAVKSNLDTAERAKAEKLRLIEKQGNLTKLIPELQKQADDWAEKAARAALTKEEQLKLDELNANIARVEANKKTLNEKIEQVDKARFENAAELENLTEKLHSHELAAQKIESDLGFLQERIAEEYNEDYEGCLKYKVDDFDVSAASSKIINYKRQLTMLGAVNPNAIEEYEEENARYEKMMADKEDMEKAIDDLTKGLNDIKNEMLKIFNEGFTLINENFKRTFKELFGGGKAELELDYTDCDDPLDAGVEIVACPPGKNLKKISLLSGGEQALTAIAILFAIIQMRPMPFCVLDEIEAALDDANVGRYAAYLKKFAEKTQFIVITHRKPTMEKADVLFGVTMEEKGVSKIVSVKLSEVESKLGGDTIS